MTEISLKQKLTWQCRRGMLELDVILIPFLDNHFEQLADEEQHLFADLLEQADPDLYTWIMGFGRCSDEKLSQIVQLIRAKMGIAT